MRRSHSLQHISLVNSSPLLPSCLLFKGNLKWKNMDNTSHCKSLLCSPLSPLWIHAESIGKLHRLQKRPINVKDALVNKETARVEGEGRRQRKEHDEDGWRSGECLGEERRGLKWKDWGGGRGRSAEGEADAHASDACVQIITLMRFVESSTEAEEEEVGFGKSLATQEKKRQSLNNFNTLHYNVCALSGHRRTLLPKWSLLLIF